MNTLRKNKKIVFALLAGSSLLSWNGVAYAAEQQAESQSESVQEGGLSDIIVTATRREERLQDIPVAVTAVTGDTLANSGISDVREVMFAVPGFTGGRNFGVLQPSIRGVGSSGNSPGDEANVALYVDGIYQPHANGNIVDFGEVERIEVLRGPQGTLFGRNATGGLVNVITPDPKFTSEVKISGQYSHFDDANEFKLRGYVTAPISSSVAANLSVAYSHSEDYIENLTNGSKFGGAEGFNIRGKVLFEPSSTSEIIVMAGYADQQGGNGNVIAPLNGNTFGNTVAGNILPTRPNEVALTITPDIRIRQFTASLRTKFDFGPLALETSTGYLKDRVEQTSDTDASPILILQNNIDIRTEAFNHEMRFLSQTDGKLKWKVGAYFYDLKARLEELNIVSGIAPDYTTSRTNSLTPDVAVNSQAVFGELTYEIVPGLNLIGGARYTGEKRRFTQYLNGNVLIPERRHSSERLTYRLTGQYQFTDNAQVYVTYSTGFKSGVFNAYGTSLAETAPTRPETIDAIEVGLKADPLPWLRTNISFFDYSYKDLQVVARDTNNINAASYILINAGRAKIRGVDIEVQAALGREFRLSAAGNILDATYKNFPNAQVFFPVPGPTAGSPARGNTAATVDVSGNNMVRAPDYTFTISGDWSHETDSGTFGANVSLFGSGRVYYDFNNRLSQDPYVRLNGQVSWTTPDEKLRFRIFGTNLLNKTIIQQASETPLTDQVTYERPREIGVGVDMKF
ncbi:TonB-dependent receptor [Sphingobium phenoxybenzoativorans]|uniref:TonB-dependent receptor n=1 Tax=Sphingobium phenoxybenzoativorans TaxID=1592790 RepID=A0A1W5YR13_9SPHN|nr:TonB-dependent receptor [Sphingobium phenoxybenzoativorans]ARI47599.1 TonB-dependent receptor [Sphingobium phenoxybenzoativorans]